MWTLSVLWGLLWQELSRVVTGRFDQARASSVASPRAKGPAHVPGGSLLMTSAQDLPVPGCGWLACWLLCSETDTCTAIQRTPRCPLQAQRWSYRRAMHLRVWGCPLGTPAHPTVGSWPHATWLRARPGQGEGTHQLHQFLGPTAAPASSGTPLPHIPQCVTLCIWSPSTVPAATVTPDPLLPGGDEPQANSSLSHPHLQRREAVPQDGEGSCRT